MESHNDKIEIMNEWKNSGRGVFSEANAQLQARDAGHSLLNEVFKFFKEVETLPAYEYSPTDNRWIELFYYDCENTLDGFTWRICIACVSNFACVVMLKPISSKEYESRMHSTCLTRASVWSAHCESTCLLPKSVMSYREFALRHLGEWKDPDASDEEDKA